MNVKLFILLAGVAVVNAQFVPTSCPDGWVLYSDHCYKFNSYPRYRLFDASSVCQKNGAYLVSVNTQSEHSFVIEELEKYDINRGTWLTSGIVIDQPLGISWLGDGTQVTDLSYWLEGTTADKDSSDTVVYTFKDTRYGWAVGDPLKNNSFICEIKLVEIYKIVEQRRDFDYGLAIDNPNIAPRGPHFIQEPVPTTILFKTDAADLWCLADSIPKPSYKWYTIDENNVKEELRTGADSPDKRFTTIGGHLSILEPVNADQATYQCVASNQFGTIISAPALLSFGSLGNFSNVNPNDVEGQLSLGLAVSCPKITAQPGKVYQWFKKTDTGANQKTIFIRPELQTHIFASNNGKLYFSELASSDMGYYYCIVSLSSMGGIGNFLGSGQGQYRNSPPFFLNVTKGVANDYRPVIQDDFPRSYPRSPLRGQMVQLECFAYGTKLTYQWYRYNGNIPDKATFVSTRRIMNIPNIQLEDAGEYGCRVDSYTTSEHDHKNFTLKVESLPFFTYPLTSQHVDIGSRLSWHCEARSKPAPVYSWYKDGQPLLSSTGVMISGNTMVISAVQKERDNGMYQCAATNKHGTTFSSAQIRVLEFAPTFRKHPLDTSLSAAVGGNITIICDPEAAPTPVYKWLFNNNDLGLVQGGQASNGFKMLMNGNLLIEKVNNNHQGTYTCHVSNSVGEDSSSGVLRVFPQTVISNPPKAVTQRVNESASIVCKASAPADVDVVYVWRFNDHIIDFEEFVEYRMGTGEDTGTLYILGVQFKHQGRYTCQVTTGMDSVEASANFFVKGPPGEPSGVFKGDNIGLDSDRLSPDDKYARIYWTDGRNNFGTIFAYTVEYRTKYNMTWRVHRNANQIPKSDVVSQEYSDKQTVLLKNLKPNAEHQFRVRAINEFGIGDPSLPTDYIDIPGTKPTIAPPGLRGGGGKEGTLVIKWDPLPVEDHNGPDLQYKLFWREKPSNPLDDSRWDERLVSPAEVCEYIPDIMVGRIFICSITEKVSKANYYMPYQVKILAKNTHGDGKESDVVTIMSAESMPQATPRQVYSNSFNATALEVFWTPVVNSRKELRGKLTGYRINYWDKDNEEEDQARFNIISVPAGADNIDHGMIIGLVAGNWYTVNVQAITAAGYGPKSEDYPQETGNYPPGLYPTEVHVYSIEGAGVRVNFRGISTNVAEEPLQGYMIQYWPSGENIRKARTVDTGRNNYGTITNVTESILYELRVYGYSRGGQGKRSSPSVYFTVGNGEVPSNPETTEVMAGGSLLQSSFLSLLLPLLLIFLFNTLNPTPLPSSP